MLGFENTIKSIPPSYIPLAIGIHETLGILLLGGVWGVTFTTQPSKRLGPYLHPYMTALPPRIYDGWVASFNRGISFAERGIMKYTSNRSQPRRIAVSYAESFVIRTALRPVTVPVKIWLTWKLLNCYEPVKLVVDASA